MKCGRFVWLSDSPGCWYSFCNSLPGGRLYPGIPYHPLRFNSIQGDFSLHVETGRCNHNHPPHHQQGNLRKDDLQNEFCCRMGIVWLCTSVVWIIKKFYPDLSRSNKSAVLQPKDRKHSVDLRHHWKKLWGESKDVKNYRSANGGDTSQLRLCCIL